MQMVRSTISWAVTDAIGRAQHISPLYGNPKRYRILAIRGFMGAIAMSLYYEAFERLMLEEAVSTSEYQCCFCIMQSCRLHMTSMFFRQQLSCAPAHACCICTSSLICSHSSTLHLHSLTRNAALRFSQCLLHEATAHIFSHATLAIPVYTPVYTPHLLLTMYVMSAPLGMPHDLIDSPAAFLQTCVLQSACR